MRKTIYWIFLVILTYASVESFSYGSLYFLMKSRHINYEPIDAISDRHKAILNNFVKGKTSYVVFSSTLGWTIKENGHSSMYRANASGIRSNKEYELTPPHNVLRISTFGDSFTHCDDVGNDETWQVILEKLDARLEVLNFGVGGFGLDQAYLRYLEHGSQFKPHMVFIGYMSENIFRHVNTFRPFYYTDTGIPLTKPRFVVRDEKLSLIPNMFSKLSDYNVLLSEPKKTLSKIGVNDYYYSNRYSSSVFDFSPTIRLIKMAAKEINARFVESILINGHYNERSEAFKVTKKLFDEFYASVIRDNAIPIILIFPASDDIHRHRIKKTKRYLPLLSYFDSKGYQYIDLMDAFDKGGENYALEDLFGSDHYSAISNKLVAKHIHTYLSRKDLRHPDNSNFTD